MRVVVPPWLKSWALANVLCTASYTNTNCTNTMARPITQQYLDEMWERIEDLEKQLAADPNNVGLAALLQGLIDAYYNKQELFHQQQWKS